MEMVFKFRDGSRLKGDAQIVGTKLREIRETHGRLTAPDVVEQARPKQSVLHQYFEWNNSQAAEAYRVAQARHLIAAVVVVETTEHGENKPIRAFAKLLGDDTYESIEVVLSNPDMRRRALREVEHAIKALKEKLEAFEEFSELIGALDAVEAIATRKAATLQEQAKSLG